MDKNTHAINWFEIPVTDIARARKFYEAIFDFKMDDMNDMMGMKMTGFPSDMMLGKVSGALVQSDTHKVSKEGVVIYLNANPDIQTVIDRVEAAGGTITMPRTEITPEIGCMAFFIDSEGNSIGLHAEK